MSEERFTEHEDAFFGRLGVALQQFWMHDLSIHQAMVLLHVAREEGKSIKDYAEKTGVSHSVMSSHVLDLGPRKRTGSPGLGLVRVEQDEKNLRQHVVTLTRKGRALLQTIFQLANSNGGRHGKSDAR